MSKAGIFARPVDADGKHHPHANRTEGQDSTRWSDAVHKVADTVRGWLPGVAASKEK